MHRYEVAVLKALRGGKPMTLDEALKASRLKREELLWAVENLSMMNAIEARKAEAESVELTDEGRAYASSRMPEELLLERLRKGSVRASQLAGREEQIGLQWAKKGELITISNGLVALTEKGRAAAAKGVEDGKVLRELGKTPESYFRLISSDKEAVLNLMKRGLIAIRKRNEIQSLKITAKGMKEMEKAPEREEVDALSKNIIMNRSWEGKAFKPYDVTLKVEREGMAIRHPLRKTISEIRDVYLGMGFREVSGPVIEPAFWVFDALFSPQDHPTREMQDTFFLSNPESIKMKRDSTFERVKNDHLASWGGGWKAETAEKATLRTHTTNVSVRQIDEFNKASPSEKKGRLPLKLFSIGRVFRNENIDYKHLTDFYHTDGIVMGNNLTMANLFDILTSIYKPFGMELRFKPAYFPFVEPGVEIYAYYERTKSLVEMGGAGILRREVTGVPRKNMTVLAWGLGVERLTLLRDPNIKSIAELYGSDVGWLRSRRMV